MIDQLTIRLKKSSFLTCKISKQKVWKFLLPILQTIANSTTILLKTQVVINHKKSVVKTNICLIFILNDFTAYKSNYFAKAYRTIYVVLAYNIMLLECNFSWIAIFLFTLPCFLQCFRYSDFSLIDVVFWSLAITMSNHTITFSTTLSNSATSSFLNYFLSIYRPRILLVASHVVI